MTLCTTFSFWLKVALIIICYINFPFQSTLLRVPARSNKDRINRSNQVVFTVPFSQWIFAKREFKWEFYFWKRKSFLEPWEDKPDKRLMFCVNPVEIVWKRNINQSSRYSGLIIQDLCHSMDWYLMESWIKRAHWIANDWNSRETFWCLVMSSFK